MLDARKDRIDQSLATGQGFDRPRLYDLMVLLLTRGRDRAYREELLDLVAASTGDHVLDIGCGTGTLAISAWRRVRPAGSVTGTDISEPMLAAARRKARRPAAISISSLRTRRSCPWPMQHSTSR